MDEVELWWPRSSLLERYDEISGQAFDPCQKRTLGSLGEDLPRIQNAFGVKHVFDALHHSQMLR